MAMLNSGDGGGGGGRSGCTLMTAALGMFGLVLVVSLWSLISQDRAIAKFTQDIPLPITVAEGTEEELAALTERLAAFSDGAAKGETVELALTVDDLNLIVATTEAAKDYREMVYFTGTRVGESREGALGAKEGGRFQERQIVADVCLTMNKLKFWEKRYLVGEMEFDLRPVPAGLDLIITGVTVPEKDVPQQFVNSFANWHWLSSYHEDPALKPVLEAISEVEIGEDRIVLRAGEKGNGGG